MSTEPLGEFTGTERFVIRRRIRAGGMGVVYEAYDRQRGSVVALKTLQQIDPGTLYQFKQEFRSLADLAHPNLVSLYELMSAGERWFFTMELIEGLSFLNYIRSDPEASLAATESFHACADTTAPQAEPLLPPSWTPATGLSRAQVGRLRTALRQLAAGLCSLHQARRLHRDIKPTNVLVTRQGRVVLLDFGLVSELDRAVNDWDLEQQIVGTLHYVSPEQAAGLPLSEASDWYSVGVMLYQTLTGQLPYSGPSHEILSAKRQFEPPPVDGLVPDIPEDLSALCRELLRLRPEQRPTGPEILRRLDDAPAAAVPQSATAVADGRSFVGREEPLAKLNAAWSRSRRGRTVVIRVFGPSGVGKTTLLNQFLCQRQQEPGLVVLWGRCYERESVPYKALDSTIDSLTRYLLRLPRVQTETLLPRDMPALARLFPVLRRVEAVAAAPRRGAEIPDQQELRHRAFAALRELLARVAERQGLVICIDDLQWGDLDSAALLIDLLRPPDPPPFALLACYRSEDAESRPFLQSFLGSVDPSWPIEQYDLPLAPFTEKEAQTLAKALLGPGERAGQLAAIAARESQGNPYLLVELLRAARDGRLAERGKGTVQITLEHVLIERVRKLPGHARRLLEAVAVAGRPISQEVAHRAASVAPSEQATVGVLRSAHLVRTTGTHEHDQIETYHDRIRETLVSSLSLDQLGRWHRHLAVSLAACGTSDSQALAEHWLAAGEAALAGEHFVRAAVRAEDALAFDRAAHLYSRALDLTPGEDPQRRALQIKLADALANAGRGREAAREYLAACEGASSAQRLELERRAAMQALISGHIDEGLAALRRVLDGVGMRLAPTPRRAMSALLLRRATLRLRGLSFRARDSSQLSAEELTRIDVCWSAAVGLSIVDTIRGADFQTRNLLLSLRAGEPYRIARGLAWEAAHVATAGQPARRRVEKLLRSAREMAQDIGQPHCLGLVALSEGIAAYMQGRWRPARELSNRAASIFREHCTGVAWEVDTARSFMLWALFFLGEVGELCRRLPKLLDEARQRGDLYAATNFGTFVGHLTWLAADDPQGARDDLNAVLSQWSQQGFHVQHLTALMGSTQTDLYCGDGRAAWSRLTQDWTALRGAFFLRVQTVRIFLRHLRGRSALLAVQNGEPPARLLRSAARDARRIRSERVMWALPMAQLLEAGIAASRGDQTRAIGLLAKAVSGFEAADMQLFAASARRQWGALQGGVEGDSLIAAADAWMAGQNICNPRAMTALHAPGFADAKW